MNCIFLRRGYGEIKPSINYVEYIESSGTQYIDTGVIPSNHQLEIKFDMLTYKNNDHLFGTDQDYVYYSCTSYDNEFRCGINGAEITIADWSTGIHTLLFNAGDNYGIYLDGVLCASGTKAASTHSLTFCKRGTVGLEGRIYYAKITERSTGVLVRDLYACLDPDGVACLYDKVNKEYLYNAGTGTFTAGAAISGGGAPTLNAYFANNTWGQIIAACQSGNVPATWAVGDQKTMTINGTNYAIDIIGKNHDSYTTGDTAPLTFQMHDCYETKYAMNSINSNSGGYDSTAMHTTHLPSILTKMPSEVQAAIKPVYKLASAGGASSTIEAFACKLFLLSESEIFANTSYSYSGEGARYEYYANGGSITKQINGSAANIWERSPARGSSTSFCLIRADGTALTTDANNTNGGVAPAFCF